MVCTPNAENDASFSHSAADCLASSRVGDTMSTEHPPRLSGGVRSSASMAGSANPNVLPVPVLARATTSPPARHTGMALAWTSVISEYLERAR